MGAYKKDADGLWASERDGELAAGRPSFGRGVEGKNANVDVGMAEKEVELPEMESRQTHSQKAKDLIDLVVQTCDGHASDKWDLLT